MTYTPSTCTSLLATIGEVSLGGYPCWDLWTLYILQQAKSLTQLFVGDGQSRPLGWRSDFGAPAPGQPAKGLRVSIYGFSCTNNQRTPVVFTFTENYLGRPAESEAQLVEVLNRMRKEVFPSGGTCPHLAIERAVRMIEITDPVQYPVTMALILTDGIFFDGTATPLATEGLFAYRTMTYAVAIAVSAQWGMTVEQKKTQIQQLTSFVGGRTEYMFNMNDIVNGKSVWQNLVAYSHAISNSVPSYFELNYHQSPPPIPRNTWCGYRRRTNCALDNFHFGMCRWTGLADAQYRCARV